MPIHDTVSEWGIAWLHRAMKLSSARQAGRRWLLCPADPGRPKARYWSASTVASDTSTISEKPRCRLGKTPLRIGCSVDRMVVMCYNIRGATYIGELGNAGNTRVMVLREHVLGIDFQAGCNSLVRSQTHFVLSQGSRQKSFMTCTDKARPFLFLAGTQTLLGTCPICSVCRKHTTVQRVFNPGDSLWWPRTVSSSNSDGWLRKSHTR
jgi:hypothetical protein